MQFFWIGVVATLFALALLFWRGRHPRIAAGLLMAVAVAGATGLVSPGSESRAAEPFTVHVSPSQLPAGEPTLLLWNSLYGSAKLALEGLQDASPPGETTLVFSKETGAKMLGLPAITGVENTAVAYFNDYDYDLTVIFDATFLGQDAEVLVSARWTNNTDDYEPELAVVIRVDAIDLATINADWDAFPVRFSNALIGFSNVDHTLLPSAVLGTSTFFDDTLPTADSFRIIPTGAALQAVVHDDPAEEDPLLDGAGVLGAVETIVVRGSAGKIAGAGDDDPAIKALDLTASVTVATPDALREAGVTLDSTWSVQVRADSGGTYFGRLAGDATLDLGDAPTSFGAALNIAYDKTTKKASFKIEGSVGDVNNLFSQGWLDLKQLKVVADIAKDSSKTPPETTVGMLVTANLTLGTVTAQATLSSKLNLTTNDVEFSLALSAAGSVSVDEILTALGAPAVDDDWEVSLTNFGVQVTVKKPSTSAATVVVAVTGGADLLERTCGGTVYPAGSADLLFKLQVGGGNPTTFFVAASLSGLDVKNLSCDIPFQWTLPSVMLMAGNSEINTPWLGVDAPTRAFFEDYFCGETGVVPLCNSLQRFICPPGSTIPCPGGNQSLKITQGFSVRALVTVDGDMTDALAELGIEVDGPLVITGTVPLFGGNTFALTVSLPPFTTGEDDIVAGGAVIFTIEASPTGVEAKISGNIDFRVLRPNQDTCATVEPSGEFSNGDCYDALNLAVSIGVEATATPPSVELSVSAFLSNWVHAFGEENLTINAFAIDLTIKAGSTGVSVEIGMRGDLVIGETDLQIAFLVELGAAPPRIILKGLTVGSAKGIALRDIVKAFAPDIDEEALPPDLSLKNIWFAYGIETNPTLCIRQGLFISAELHLSDPDPDSGAGTNPACGGNGVPMPDCGPGETSCLAAVQIDIGPNRFKAYGALAAFDVGPISFGGAELLIDLTLLKQEIYFKGSATLYDPIAYYANDPDGTDKVWASAYLKIQVKQDGGEFTLGLTGCALIGGSAVADENCTVSSETLLQAYIDGTITADFTKVGMEFFESATATFEVSLSSPALEQLIEDLEEELEPVVEFFEDAGAAIEGTATEVITKVDDQFCVSFNPNCADLQVTASAYSDAPSYIDAVIAATDTAIKDSAALNVYCALTFDWPVDECVQEYRDIAKAANNATIAAYGGRSYIALHGIDATGFGGIKDADVDITYVNATRFVWPAAGTPALCDAGGALYGTSACSAAPGAPVNVDDLVADALLWQLEQIDPTLAALLADGSLQAMTLIEDGPAVTIAAQSLLNPGQFVADIRTLANTFDLAKPLSICEATTTFAFDQNGAIGDLGLQTKTNAYGGLSTPTVNVTSNPSNQPELDLDAIKASIIADVLQNAVTSLDCPVATPQAELSFTMTASAINEGDVLGLTGKAPAGAIVTVQWGDGSTNSTATADTTGAWLASHKYLDGPAVRVVKATMPDAQPAASLVIVSNVAPSITTVNQPSAINEGGEVTLTGSFTDPGTLDSHVVTVNWGDGMTSQQELAAGNSGAFSLKHTYVDDDPTSTVEDTYAIAVTVRDKDKGSDADATSVLVRNVGPYDLQLAGATWDGGSATTDADGNLVVPEGTPVTWSGTFRDPGLSDTHNVVVSWGDGKFGSAIATPDATDSALVHFSFTHTFADDHPAAGTPSDLVQLRIQVRDDDTSTASVEPRARIANVAPAVEVAPTTQNVQYSDPIASIVLTVTDVVGIVSGDLSSEILEAATQWNVDGGEWQDGLFGDLAWSEDGCEWGGEPGAPDARQSCTWSIEGLVNVAPGTYVIKFTVTDDDTGTTVTTAEVVVLPEDARATYNGPTAVSAPTLANGYVDVMLRATIRDISVVPGIEPPDTWPGDIRNATVAFVDRAGGTLCEAPVVEIFAGNTTTGGASCVARLLLPAGQSSRTIVVGTVVGGWYIRDDASDDVTVTIEAPTGDWVTGGFSLAAGNGAGTHAPSGSPTVNVSTGWKMPGLSALDGSLRIQFASAGRQYEVEVTSFDSVGTIGSPSGKAGVAQVEARATLFDITGSKSKPVTVATGLRLQFRASDTDQGTGDSASFALWSEDGHLISASNWAAVLVPESVLTNGKVQVHFK